MPAPDQNHEQVRQALINDGWTITDDPYVIEYEDLTLFADLGAERILAAQRDDERIVVEIKSFTGPSVVREFETALGHSSYIAQCWKPPIPIACSTLLSQT